MRAYSEFLRVVVPVLLEIAEELFMSSGGNVEVAKEQIENLNATVKSLREARDEQLRQKHG